MRKNRTLTFEQACAQYPHRYTMEHKPAWANTSPEAEGWPTIGKYYAPQFRTDREWYEAAFFPGEHCFPLDGHCYVPFDAPTWPLGQWLDEPFKVGGTV